MKILLVYCNLSMEPLLPLGIASLSASLKQQGHEVKVFDTTLYPSASSDQEDREASKQVDPVDWESVGIRLKETNIEDDFIRYANKFDPDITGFSCTEATYPIALKLKKALPPWNDRTIIGGPFATFASKQCRKDGFNYVWVGEGEFLLDYPDIYYNIDESLVDLNTLPIPDFTEFEENRIYRPMSGKLYRMLPVEIGRGCLYNCSYCSAPQYRKKFKGWNRIKDVDKVINEMGSHIEKYNVEYFYLVSETFLAMPNVWKSEFYYNYYYYVDKPFWMNTRPETVNEYDIRNLKEIGCHRISMGLECGNEEFRKKILNRNYSNKTVIEAAKMIKDAGIELSINNMIGFPDETEELIMETIEVNRQIEADSHTVSVFQPYKGTALHDYCISKGYYDKDQLCTDRFAESKLEMPQLSKERITEFYFNFNDRIKEE